MLDPDASAHTRESLYKRLGGYDAIAAFVADLMPRLYNDPTLWVYWKGKSVDSRRKGEQLLIEFLCSAFGGPAFYAGPDMKSSHRGLGITLREWNILLGHLDATFDALGVPEPERVDVMAATESLKWDIVEEPSPAAAQ
jgi:hemoglobin